MSTPVKARLMYTDGTGSSWYDTQSTITEMGVAYKATITTKAGTVTHVRVKWATLSVDLDIGPEPMKVRKGTRLPVAGEIDIQSLVAA